MTAQQAFYQKMSQIHSKKFMQFTLVDKLLTIFLCYENLPLIYMLYYGRKFKMENKKIIDGKDLADMKFIRNEDGTLSVYEPKGRFYPKEGEKYWFIDSVGYVACLSFHEDMKEDLFRLKNLILFRTREEAEDYRLFLEQVVKLRKNFIENRDNYYFYYSFNNKMIKINCNNSTFSGEIILGHNKNDICRAKEILGECRIKKYLFDIWD